MVVVGIHSAHDLSSAHDLGLSDLIEAVLLACRIDLLKRKEAGIVLLSWVVKTWAGSVKKHVIGPQISKDSATRFTMSFIFCPFHILIDS